MEIALNGWDYIGKEYSTGLAYVESVLPTNIPIDTLIKDVYDYVQPIYYPGTSPSRMKIR